VSGVDYYKRPPGDDLDSRGEGSGREAACHRSVVDTDAPGRQLLCRDNGQSSVPDLVTASETSGVPLGSRLVTTNKLEGGAVETVSARRRFDVLNGEVGAEFQQRGTPLGGGIPNHVSSRGLRHSTDDSAAALDDARFLRRNPAEGGPEQLQMVMTDTRDHRDEWSTDICGIQPPAESGFQDGKIDLFVNKVNEGCGSHHLEPGGALAAATGGPPVHRIDDRNHPVKKRGQTVSRDRRAIDGDAFSDIVDVRRQIAADVPARSLKDRGHHGGGRTLALRARDMCCSGRPVRIPKGTEKSTHSREAERGRRVGCRGSALVVHPSLEPHKRLRPARGGTAMSDGLSHAVQLAPGCPRDWFLPRPMRERAVWRV